MAANKKSRVQSEIEAFLAEVTGGKPKKPPQDQERQARKRQQAEAKRRQLEKQKQAEAKRKKAATQSQTGSTVRRNVQSGISDHVDQYITKHVNEHIDHDVNEYVEATIVDSVDSHLGRRDTEMPGGTARPVTPGTAQAVAKLLRDPAGIRNAILVSEILARPVALRRERE